MTKDVWIGLGTIRIQERSAPTDVVALPDYGDGASLFTESDWAALIEEYGTEAALLKALGVKEDLREPEDRWEPIEEEIDARP
jgi:hypothetical protein